MAFDLKENWKSEYKIELKTNRFTIFSGFYIVWYPGNYQIQNWHTKPGYIVYKNLE